MTTSSTNKSGQQVAPEVLEAHYAWIKGSKEIAGLMLMSMDSEIQRNLEPLHAHEVLKELKTLFAQQAEQELLQTTRDFHSLAVFSPALLHASAYEGIIGITTSSDYDLRVFPTHGELFLLVRPLSIFARSSLVDLNRVTSSDLRPEPIPPVPEAPEGQQVAPEILDNHHAWIKGSKEIAGLMLMKQELLQTTRDFHSCKQEEGQSVSLYVLKMKGYIDNLERLGHRVTLGLGVSLILIGLRKEYDGFVQNYNMHSMGKTVNELHAMLKLYEQTLTLPKSNAPALHVIQAGKVQKGNKHKKSHSQKGAKGENQEKGKFAPKPKIPPPPKRENPTNDSICHECREIGHWKRNCPQYLAELMKKKKNTASRAGGSGIFVIELNTILNRSWIYDTDCGPYICNTTQGLRASRKLKPGALNLYVGNGQREVVEAIGTFYLCLPSGLEIVLNNCHYAPSITRGVISVSLLYKDGFVNRFVDNTIQVSRNNVVYFSAVPRDGIFEIDLSNSLTNESSIYAVSNKRAQLNLDSALLWHCRLGHISKKRIEKLQHDGLLNSSDLTAFEKCVSCMFRKMARKPYTHQVERGKDLLGLIHTDEVENQLGKTIKSLRSDRGGEYMSQEFFGSSKGSWDYRPSYSSLHSTTQWCVRGEKQNSTRYGYPKEIIGYSFYYPPDNKIIVVRNAKFLENSLIDQEARESLEDLEIIQEEDTHPSLETSLNHEEDDLEIDEPQSDIVPIRRSTRTRHAPDRKLKRSIYGLKQASRPWNKRFDDEIKKFGFIQNRDEPRVYQKASGSNITFLILYVDDILIMGNSIPML
nr:hypothetical protein [Tanacetum cinerariifolium]